MRDSTLPRGCLLLLMLVAATFLVDAASQNDDLVFDQDGKQSLDEIPLIETRQQDSILHRLRRRFLDFFNPTTSTSTEAPEPEENNADNELDNDPLVQSNDDEYLEKSARDTADEFEVEADEENEVGNAAEGRRESANFGNSDDEDLAGSGEMEGSADDTRLHNLVPMREERKYYRITLTVGEPFRREYVDRNSREYKELSGNLTQPLEELLNRYIPNENHHVNVIKISPTSDSFTSQVTLDIGSTFTDEMEVRNVIEQQLHLHSLGNVQVRPEEFSFRVFQVGEEIEEPECDQSTEIRCKDGTCVPVEWRCDGISNCKDGSDEEGCPETTTHVSENITEFYEEITKEIKKEEDVEGVKLSKCRADDTVRCSDESRYICSVQKCDGVKDCDDGDDEVGCPHPGCSPGEFACDVSRCILASHRCNFIKECDDGSDEHDCSYPACTASQFKCRNEQCVDSSARCNGVNDCFDHSDELNCPCGKDQFECTPGVCISNSKQCDGVMDCNNGKDEENCRKIIRCRSDEFECLDGSCVSQTARCDGRSDCRDRSDEYNCTVTTCSGDQFRCLDGTCISIDKRCNQNIDCRNGEDEKQCGCGATEFRCTDGRCIGYELQCNGVEECSDGSDERDCEKSLWRNVYNDRSLFLKFLESRKWNNNNKNNNNSFKRRNSKRSREKNLKRNISHDPRKYLKMHPENILRFVKNNWNDSKISDKNFPSYLKEVKNIVDDDNNNYLKPGKNFQRSLKEVRNVTDRDVVVGKKRRNRNKNRKKHLGKEERRFKSDKRNETSSLGVSRRRVRAKKKSKKSEKMAEEKEEKSKRVFPVFGHAIPENSTILSEVIDSTVSTTSNSIENEIFYDKLQIIGSKEGIEKSSTRVINEMNTTKSETFHNKLQTVSSKSDETNTWRTTNDIIVSKFEKDISVTTEIKHSTMKEDEKLKDEVEAESTELEMKDVSSFTSDEFVTSTEASEKLSSTKSEDLEEDIGTSTETITEWILKRLKESFVDSSDVSNTNWSSEEDLDKRLGAIADKEKNSSVSFRIKHSSGENMAQERATPLLDETVSLENSSRTMENSNLFDIFVDDSSKNSIESDIVGSKAKKRFTKYFREYSVTPSILSSSTSAERENEKEHDFTDLYFQNATQSVSTISTIPSEDYDLSAKVETELFETGRNNSKVRINLLSDSRLSTDLSIPTRENFKDKVYDCTSKCVNYWKRLYEMKEKNYQELIEKILKNDGRIDSGLIDFEESSTFSNPDFDNSPDSSQDVSKFAVAFGHNFARPLYQNRSLPTEPPNLIKIISEEKTREENSSKEGKRGNVDRTNFNNHSNSSVNATLSTEHTFKEFQSRETVDQRRDQQAQHGKTYSTNLPAVNSFSTSRTKCKNSKNEEDEFGENCEKDSTMEWITDYNSIEETITKGYGDVFVDVTSTDWWDTETFKCDQDQFLCEDGTCIEKDKICDGVMDCEGSTDEFNCDNNGNDGNGNGNGNGSNESDEGSTCMSWEFLCNGTCISNLSLLCNNKIDCDEGFDEADCETEECPDGQLPCDNKVCINKNFFCDNNIDCHDGSDERDCNNGVTQPPRCREDEFTCRDGTCIPQSAFCDERPDCPYAEDEANCLQGCGKDQFQCADGNCIRIEDQCNGYIDCADGTDENDCDHVGSHPMPGRCPAGFIMCIRDKDCVPQSSLCNGIPECRDRSDEEYCNTEPSSLSLKTYPSEQVIKESREVVFQCRDEGPLRAKVRWLRGNNLPLPSGSRDINGRLEIPNIQLNHSGSYICEAVDYPPSTPGQQVSVYLTVEKFDPPATSRPHVCQYDEATCSNGECIPKSYVCNDRLDCTDGSDEMRCSPHGCEPNQFRCNNTQCVSKLWRCDGDKDCADGSDEENCAPNKPGSPCRFTEFACASNNQCIPKSYHCDMEKDCLDASDEIGCSPVFIVKPPVPMITLNIGEVLTITCTAIGVPTPEINWRLNWGHVPPKCTMTSINGTGTLTCPNIQPEDQGAYSCEGLNNAGFVFAIPDAIVMVNKSMRDICPKGMFNSEARNLDECISCFCFGVATECHSANLFTYHIPPPIDRHNIIEVKFQPNIQILNDITGQISILRNIDRNGIQLYQSELLSNTDTELPYFALPETYYGNQLKSYGGYLKYRVRFNGTGVTNSAPSVILSGNNYRLVHRGKQLIPNYDNEEIVRFFQGEWYKQQRWNEIPATREDIMMTLENVDNILIKAQYDNSPYLDIQITNIVMDTADVRNTGLGSASYVEECECPSGYSGLSCEQCAPGYLRRQSGPWLGQCYRDEPPCSSGYYGDPSRNIPCQMCPCPLTNPSNQFARTCQLGSDGQPTCNCPPGYIGRRCEQCDVGYQGNPLIPGDMCVPISHCDPDGSLSLVADPITGRCRCKLYATGLTCNQCKANTFNLATKNQFGCISCFCMGITNKCVSSNWYRNDIRVSFTNSIRDFSLIESKSPDTLPIVNGIRLDAVNREIIYSDFPNRGNNDVYYWQLPSIFLGDQITSYGGNLKYTVRYVPSPGGQSSKNNAADVELISANDINLLYFSREFPEPNTPQTFTVPLLEQYWQRNDGTQADREHLLMALADVRAIKIKATYTTHTDEAALSLVSLDTAEKYNTGKIRAVEVEECTCPVGYKGLSCEDCDVGYTRASEGLYLGICEPCNCNGHSNQCNPDTGVCENCAHHTTGDFCDICESGYEGDATRGTPYDCTYSTERPCMCNELGSRSSVCIGNVCDCKRNVEGSQCNRCRSGTFGLSAENPNGCNECYCSGLTDQCHESSLYIQQIPMWVYDNQHGFTLTDSSRQEIIDDGFELNFATNEIGYRYPDSRGRRLFWSLPTIFTGNKVKSYGGNLTLTQHITAYSGAQSYKDQDIILIGNGITLFWTNPTEIQPDIPLTYSVPFRESEWKRLTTEGPHVTSRIDLMTVLSNLEAILVRATHSEWMTATYISDISLDTAVEHQTGNKRAIQVEVCRCPTGYVGTSCESCARGYYRDTNDRSVSYLGSCILCPCNNNEESCEMTRIGQVKCHCQPGYVGQYCQDTEGTTTSTTTFPTITPPKILIYIRGPEFQIIETGSTVRYHCSGTSVDNGSLYIKWEKEGGQLPPGRSVDDNHGLLVIRDVKVSDSGIYVCQVSDGVHIGYKNVTLTVGAAPRTIVIPPSLQVVEGHSAEFRCEASGNPPPQIEWIRVHGPMNPEVIVYNGAWILKAVSKSDAAEYKCIARNNIGIDERTVILYVEDNPETPPSHSIPPTITPPQWIGSVGDTIVITCIPSLDANVTWTRERNIPLPPTANQRDGILTIINPSTYDSGIYICTAISYIGTVAHKTINITVTPRRPLPTIKVTPEKQTVPQGSIAEVKCFTTGEPGVQVKWSKYLEQMSPNVQQIGDTLRIVNIQIADRGVYVCRVTGSSGSHEASAIIEVEPREPPLVEIYPKNVPPVTLGGSTDLQCRAIAGIPIPVLQWSHEDGRPFASNIKQLPGGVLRLSNITTNDGGSYICSAVNSVGSNSATVYIEVQSVPIILITPKSGILTVKPGDRVRLVCSATGYPQPTVAWSKHMNVVPLGTTNEVIDTPQKAVYEIYSASPNDEGSYTCHANNAAGIVEERVYIRVEDSEVYPPCRGDVPCLDTTSDDSIPKDYLRIPNGGKVEMRCHVHDNDGNHIYLDWKRTDHRALPNGSSVHNGVLIIPAVDKSAAGEYVCSGMDQAGNLLFKAKSHLEVLSPPRIVLIPPRQTVRSGESPSIECRTNGDEPMTIEWNAIGRSLPYSVTHNRGLLQFHGITYSDAGKYVCKATNDAGTAEAVAEVLVNEHPYENTEVKAAQRDIVTYVGQPVRLRCMVRERATIHWVRDGQPLPSNVRIEEDYLELPRVRPEDSGRYICQIQTSHGVSSDYINLNVSPTPIPAVSVEVSQDPVNIGDTIDIRCACSGTHNPRYHWSRPNHLSLPENAQEYGNILRLSNVAVSDSGLYRCTADTPEGVFKQDFNLVVHGGNNDAPAIETKYAPYGSSLEMDCRPNIDPPMKFHWSKLGGFLPPDAQIFESKLKLINVKAEDAGTYICSVNNNHENIEIPTVLVVTGVVPYFSQAPRSFIALSPLRDSYLKFNIEISFKPQSYDGIILYNDESSSGNGDFVLLSLVRGYPQFSFNLGSGPAIIRADKSVTLGEWHTIKLQRNRKEGTMLVDGEGPYKGVAVGKKQGLDLKALLFIGGVPSDNIITQYAEINSGFVGCISRLIIGEKEIDLIGDQTDSVGITNCETCAENPCNNGGVCQEAATKNGYLCLCRAGYSGKHCDYIGQPCYPGACGEGNCVNKETGFECYCPPGRTGSRCENSIKIYEPAFHDDKSFIAHETPKALRRARMNPIKTYGRLRARNAQVRKPRSRPHHHNKLHHTKH